LIERLTAPEYAPHVGEPTDVEYWTLVPASIPVSVKLCVAYFVPAVMRLS
jgi:hypothetical protein